MERLAWAVFVVLVALALAQTLPALGFLRALGRGNVTPPADAACPKAAIVLCLRGCDPFLNRCLEGLLRQDYPQYDVWIIIDREDDPAWSVVQETIARLDAQNVYVQSLQQRLKTCALKCSSLIQAVGSLDDSYQVVALTDGDTLVHPTWLRELVAPLDDPQVGVASGNRWYMPSDASWGSLVRYVWNAAAVVQMYLNRFTWGGSVALAASVFRDPGLAERWRQSVSSDTVILDVVRRQGLRAAFVPSLMMVNRESCTLGQFYRWVQRQMLVGRLYHPGWPVVLLHGAATTAALAIAVATVVASLVQGQWMAAAWIAAGLLAFEAMMLGLLAALEACVRRVVRARGEPAGWLTPAAALRGLLAIPLTQIVYAAALGRASTIRTVNWRGAVYRIEGPWNVRLIEDRPIHHAPEPTAETTASL